MHLSVDKARVTGKTISEASLSEMQFMKMTLPYLTMHLTNNTLTSEKQYTTKFEINTKLHGDYFLFEI